MRAHLSGRSHTDLVPPLPPALPLPAAYTFTFILIALDSPSPWRLADVRNKPRLVLSIVIVKERTDFLRKGKLLRRRAKQRPRAKCVTVGSVATCILMPRASSPVPPPPSPLPQSSLASPPTNAANPSSLRLLLQTLPPHSRLMIHQQI